MLIEEGVHSLSKSFVSSKQDALLFQADVFQIF